MPHAWLAPTSQVLILYPLPCEDPLLSLRRIQAIGDSLTGQNLGAAGGLGGGSGATGGATVVHATSSHVAADEACDSTSSRDRIEYLYNLHEMEWQPGFDERTPPDEQDTILVHVLNLAPPRPTQHALIRFVGTGGQELGQAVFCVGDWRHAGGRPSAFSVCPANEAGDETESCASDSYASSSYYFTPSASMQPESEGQPPTGGGVLAQRHCINLSVGGRYKGTVSFDLAIKAKKPSGDQVRLQWEREREREQRQG